MEESDTCGLTCRIHRQESVTAYCLKHEQNICMKCILGAHKACVNGDSVENIADTANRIEMQIPESIRMFDSLTTNTQHWRTKYSQTLESLEETKKRLMSGIEKLRLKMTELTNRLASEALEMVNSVIEDQRTMVKHDLTELVELERKVKEINRDVERFKDSNGNDIEEMINIVNTVNNLNSAYENTELIDRDIKLHFYISDELQFMRKNLKSFGELSVEDPNRKGVVGLRARLSNASLTQSTHGEEDDMDSAIFVKPSGSYVSPSDKSIYCSINVERTPCKPPPLPDMHPNTQITKKSVFADIRANIQTPPGMTHQAVNVPITDAFNEPKAKVPLPMPPLPKRRTASTSITDHTKNNNSNNSNELELADEHSKACDGAKKVPELRVRPPTTTGKLIQLFEGSTNVDSCKLSQNSAKGTHGRLKSLLSSETYNSDSSVDSIGDSDKVFSDSGLDKIPALPKMHRSRYSLNKRIESLACSEDREQLRHSDGEFMPNNFEMSPQKTPSLTDLSVKRKPSRSRLNSSDSSMDSGRSVLSPVSSNTSLESKFFDSSQSEASSEQSSYVLRRAHPEMRVVSPLDTETRKTVSFNLLSSFGNQNNSHKSPVPAQHSTITGIAVTNSGILFICDTENNCLQLFDDSGSPLYDYRIKKPFSCCTVRDEVVAVTSEDRKSLCVFDISNSKIACLQEQIVQTDGEVFGIDYTKGFFGICCGDKVAILTEELQPYRTVKPVVMLKKKRARPYFVEVRYIAMEWSKVGFFIYTSENKIDRVSCVVVGNRDRPVWNCHVGKPKSLLVHKENVIVAGKHKLVVLEAATGQRLREIHNEVPTHPVHMVMLDGWLYISKTSSSSTESRNIRKIPLS